MDAETDRDHHLEDHDILDMFLRGQEMVAISLEIIVHLGGDQTLEKEKRLDIINCELRAELQTSKDVSDANVKLVSKSGRLILRSWMVKSRMSMK